MARRRGRLGTKRRPAHVRQRSGDSPTSRAFFGTIGGCAGCLVFVVVCIAAYMLLLVS